MTQHAIERLIEQADTAINQEDFNTLIGFYADDAVLVVKPGTNAREQGRDTPSMRADRRDLGLPQRPRRQLAVRDRQFLRARAPGERPQPIFDRTA
jgi:hypothetical protein